MSILEVHKKSRDFKNEVKEVIVEGNRVAFRAEQYAFFVPNDEYVTINVMNLYTLVEGKVKEWWIWFCQHVDLTVNG